MKGSGRNMYVFRDGRCAMPGPTLVGVLAAGLQHLAPALSAGAPNSRNLLIDALMRAGELECALADLRSPEASRVAELTDLLARLLVGATCAPAADRLLALLPGEVPDTLHLSPPEGFAFYALHPLDFADLAANLTLHSGADGVVGIRSIGTTLSAIVAAALRRRGVCASRITVRPTGHPYDRCTEFDVAQLRWIAGQRAREADFLVVDEGPGMSGSSFLSVGEALLGAGVARSRVQFLCSRHPDASALCARDAATRWNSFCGSCCWPNTHLPPEAKLYVGGGYWRNQLLPLPASSWPATWSQMERLKFLSSDKRVLFKFEGFGRFGAEIVRRTQLLANAGFAAAPADFIDGFACYPMFDGAMLRAADLDRSVLERIAAYCAFRAREFRCDPVATTAAQLETMLRFNVSEEFGVELDGDLGPLRTESPVLVDGRMLPHEWLRRPDGALMKCDAASHGDDHFFPGPAADIAWDLAGAIVEWNLSRAAADALLSAYTRLTGDDARRRLRTYVLAYAVFRLGYCKMAAVTMHGSEEADRLLRDYRYYRECAFHTLAAVRGGPLSSAEPARQNHLMAAD